MADASPRDLDPLSLTLLYDVVLEAPENQLKDAGNLDDKIWRVFTVASIVVGLVGISNRDLGRGDTVTALLVLTVVAYAAALTLTVLQLRVEKQRRLADAM